MQAQEILFDRSQIPSDLLEFFEPAQCGGCYLCHMVEICREIRRVLRKDGTFWLNIGDSYAAGHGGSTTAGNYIPKTGSNKDAKPRKRSDVDCASWSTRDVTPKRVVPGLKPKDLMLVPQRLAIRLCDDGWWVRSDIAWCKKSAMPESCTDRPTSAWEHVFLLTKSAKYFYDQEAVKEEAEYGENRATYLGGTERLRQANIVSGGLIASDKGIDRPATSKRNMRNFWLLGPSPFPEAHFATFPPEIPRRAILAGTSERGVCPKCGAGWERSVKKTALSPLIKGDDAPEADCWGGDRSRPRQRAPDGTFLPRTDDDRREDFTLTKGTRAAIKRMGDGYDVETLGWRPTCACDAGAPVPATVLDPFSGVFTTCLVAEQLQRDSIGIELSEKYIAMGRKRLAGDAPLFYREAELEADSDVAPPLPLTI